MCFVMFFFFFQAEDGIRDADVTGVQTCALPIYTYQWDNNAGNQTTATATGLGAGTYCVTITDDLGEVDSYCVTLTQPDAMQFNSFITPDNSGNCTGNIQLLIGGGVEPYVYSWTQLPGQTGPLAENLCMGSYDIIVTDANGCELEINRQVGGIAGLTPEVNGEFKVQLYPNPVQEKLTIRAEKEISNVRIMN